MDSSLIFNNSLCLSQLDIGSPIQFVFVPMLLIIVNAMVIVGNSLAIIVVISSIRLRRSVSNILIVSLAFSDLILGVFVLPIAIINQTVGHWLFGPFMCRIWLTLDVWMCTASIYNLVVITIDRFVAVAKPLLYKTVITTKKMLATLIVAWLCSFFIGLPLIFFERTKTSECQCDHMLNSATYIIVSSFFSFYVPFALVIYFYVRIYKRIRQVKSAMCSGVIELNRTQKSSPSMTKKLEISPLLSSKTSSSSVSFRANNLRVHKGGYCFNDSKSINYPLTSTEHVFKTSYLNVRRDSPLESFRPRSKSLSPLMRIEMKERVKERLRRSPTNTTSRASLTSHIRKNCEFSVKRYQKRLAFEMNALKTVGVVTGSFIICWLGFCLTYALRALTMWDIPESLFTAVSWFGYLNSAINPIIYAACNRQYRKRFRSLLSHKRRTYDPTKSSSVTNYSNTKPPSFDNISANAIKYYSIIQGVV